METKDNQQFGERFKAWYNAKEMDEAVQDEPEAYIDRTIKSEAIWKFIWIVFIICVIVTLGFIIL